MSDFSRLLTNLPPEQEAIRAKCFHPSRRFEEFPIEDVEKSIPDRFEKIVRRYPDRIAVKARDHAVTYAELNAMANRLARTMSERSSTIAEPVGVLVDQSVSLMAVMLGVLKAGKFFVLLDPSFPKARIAAMLEDSQAKLLVTDKQNVASAKELANSGVWLVEFDSIREDVPTENLVLPLSPQSLACIGYTSGSTGQPKGVVALHRNLLHDTMLRTNAYHISNRDRLSLLASADLHSVKSVFFAFLNGATLLPFDVRREGVVRLANWLSQERISICRINVQLFRQLCETLTGKESFRDFRLIQFAGDSRFTSDVDLWKKYFPATCLLANGFSSNETGYLTDYFIDHETDTSCSEMPAGYTVEDKDIFLVDETGNAVGCNEVAEIAVSSSYLSPGYWRRPELTEAKFKTDPRGRKEKRIYFTGDLCVLLPNGCLVYRGRKDFRVKIRGYTVETADIENVLLKHPSVREIGVVAWDQESGEKFLAAYVVPRANAAARSGELRNFLRQELPDYMIPSAFMFLESLPLTNGKLNRKALPKPENKRPEMEQPYVSPRSEIEGKLGQIWEAILDLRPIGVHDDFFELGGHSLLAMQIIAKINDAFQVDVSVRRFSEAATVEGLAELIETLRWTKENAQHFPSDLKVMKRPENYDRF